MAFFYIMAGYSTSALLKEFGYKEAAFWAWFLTAIAGFMNPGVL